MWVKLREQPVRLRSDPASISAAGDDTALYVTARLVATGKGEPAGYLPSSALARYALHDGRKEAYRSWADGEPPQVVPTNDARLDLVRDGTRVSVNARTLSAVDSPLVNTGNAETVRHETRYWLEGGWMALVGEAREALRAAPADQVSGTSYEAPRACPGGGTETYTRSADSNGYAVSYEACIVGDYTLTGRIENDNSITNRSSDSTDLYDRLRIVRTGRDPVTLELDATVRRENLGAGRQACQGENSNRLEATARRVVLVSGNTTATMNEGIYTVAEVTTSPTGYNPQTFACDYATTLASSGEMNVTGMLGDPDPWQLSHPTRTRMSATAADGSAIELVGALDGVQLDRFVVGGQATQPSFRFGGEVSDAWGGL